MSRRNFFRNHPRIDGTRGLATFLVSVGLLTLGYITGAGKDSLTREVDWLSGFESLMSLCGDFISALWSWNTAVGGVGVIIVVALGRRYLILVTDSAYRNKRSQAMLTFLGTLLTGGLIAFGFASGWFDGTPITTLLCLAPAAVFGAFVAVKWNKIRP